ncbi:MAG: class I SAM-dependent methyltransferase [Thermotogota bacterium]|nr:class I SAM-dependent methyltransferase [Thermotogota bacterium]
MSDIVSPLAPNAIFDVGCGNGLQAETLKKTMPEVIVRGCDISSAAIEKASNRMDLCYICNIDNSDLPENSEIYDLVLCVAVLEHLYDVSHALKEIHRILKPGKHVLIQVPNLCFWKFRLEILMGKIPYILRDQRHLHSFNKGFLIERLEYAGFTRHRIFGQRERIKKLATLFPSLFSEDIFVLAMKQKQEIL